MKKYLFFCLALLFGCDDELPSEQDFPVIVTLEVDDRGDEGVTFSAEVIHTGVAEITSYGFVWKNSIEPELSLESSQKVVVGENFSKGTFEAKIESGLQTGISYDMRPFVVHGGSIVYGPLVSFISKGTNGGPWSLLNPAISGLPMNVESVGISESGNLIAGNQFFIFDRATNTYSEGPLHPAGISKGAGISIGDKTYFSSENTRSTYVFESGSWKLFGDSRNRLAGPYRFLYDFNNELFLTTGTSGLAIDLSTNQSRILTSGPGMLDGAAGAFNSNIYTLGNERKIWEYDIENDTWTDISTPFPGRIAVTTLLFAYRNKVYVGLSFDAGSYCSCDNDRHPRNFMDNQFWSYELTTGEWNSEAPMPVSLLRAFDMFYFQIDGLFYFGRKGTQTQTTYQLWSFDPTRS